MSINHMTNSIKKSYDKILDLSSLILQLLIYSCGTWTKN